MEEAAEKHGEAVSQLASRCLSWAALSIGSQGGLPTAEGGHPLAFVAPEVRRAALGIRPEVADTP